jgi:hypothetical protein
MAGDNGAEKASERSQEMAENAVKVLEAARQRYEGDPAFEQLNDLLAQLAGAKTFDDATVAKMKANARGTATDAANNYLGEARAQLSQGPGMRSGAAREAERQTAVGLGETLAQMDREIDIMAAQQRIADLINNVNAVQGMLDQITKWDQAISQANLGGGQLMLGNAQMLFNQQNVANTALGSGIGGLAGSFLGAAGKAGSIGNLLFGK